MNHDGIANLSTGRVNNIHQITLCLAKLGIISGWLLGSQRLQVAIESMILIIKFGKNLTSTFSILSDGITGSAEGTHNIVHREHTGDITPVDHLRNRSIFVFLYIARDIRIAYLRHDFQLFISERVEITFLLLMMDTVNAVHKELGRADRKMVNVENTIGDETTILLSVI